MLKTSIGLFQSSIAAGDDGTKDSGSLRLHLLCSLGTCCHFHSIVGLHMKDLFCLSFLLQKMLQAAHTTPTVFPPSRVPVTPVVTGAGGRGSGHASQVVFVPHTETQKEGGAPTLPGEPLVPPGGPGSLVTPQEGGRAEAQSEVPRAPCCRLRGFGTQDPEGSGELTSRSSGWRGGLGRTGGGQRWSRVVILTAQSCPMNCF